MVMRPGVRPDRALGERARRLLLARTSGRSAGESGSRAVDAARAVRHDLHAALQAAIREDTASSLGRAGRRLQAAVQALAAFDAAHPDVRERSAERERRADAAAEALYACVVQREALGLLDHRMLNQTYRIPPELWQRMGGQGRLLTGK